MAVIWLTNGCTCELSCEIHVNCHTTDLEYIGAVKHLLRRLERLEATAFFQAFKSESEHTCEIHVNCHTHSEERARTSRGQKSSLLDRTLHFQISKTEKNALTT